MKIVLGSQSSGRRQVLEEAGFVFEVMPADIDEKAIRHEDHEVLPLLIARAKAAALVARMNESGILITADQVVICNNEMREKPETKEEARRYLESYALYPAQTNSAVVVTNTLSGKQAQGVDIARTYFRAIPQEVIEQAIDRGDILQSAGAFLIEDESLQPYIERIEGTPDSVKGLPLSLTRQLIREVS